MTNEDKLEKKIENFVHNRMIQNDRENFELELKTNDVLRTHVKTLLSLVTLYNAELFELMKKLEAAEKQLEQDNFFKDKESL